MPRYRFQAGVGDRRRATTDAAPANIGNRIYTLSLPPGEYESEDADDLMRINRADGVGPHEFVAAVPAGRYTTEVADDGVVHLYKEPDDEPVRVALSEGTVDVAHRATTERAALRQLNKGNSAFWDRQKRPGGNAVISDINRRNTDFWAGRR